MGFGAFDESEQERRNNQEQAEEDDDVVSKGDQPNHGGEVKFEHPKDIDSLMNKLEEMKDE